MGGCSFAAYSAPTIHSDLFVAARAGHEFADGLFGALVVVKDGVHLFGDGHFDGVACGEAEGSGGADDAFGYLAIEAGDDVGQLAAASELDADCAVARERASAGEDEVADAGEAGKGLASASAGDGETSHLGYAAGDEGGGGVVAEVEAMGDAGGESDDVLQGAAEFYAGDVVVRVDAKGGRGEVALDGLGDRRELRGDDDRGGHAGGDLLREGWTAEHGEGIVRDCGNDLRHAEEGGLLDALAGAEDDLVSRKQGGDVGDDAAQVLRRRDTEEDVGFEDGAWEVGGDLDVDGEGEAGEVVKVFACVGELLGECGGVGPEAELVPAAACEREGERGAPGSGAKDRDSAHAAAFFLPKRFSVPARRRRMFSWCLTMIRRGMKRKPAMTIGVR